MGATVFAIGVGDEVDAAELTGMVGGKGERYLKANTYEELNTEIFFKDIQYKLCKEQCKGKQMDIAFVLDGSSSLHEEKNFKKELSFVTDVVERIRMSNDETRVSIVKFSNNARLEVPFNMYHDVKALKNKVQTIRWEGGDTYMNKAFDMVVDKVYKAGNGARAGVEKLVVVITDGVSTKPTKTDAAIKRLHGIGANVFAIGVGPEVNMKELAKISTNSQYYTVDNINALDSVQSILNDQLCPNNTERCYQQPLEVCFLLDSSTSLNSSEMFYKELGFVAGLGQRFDIGNDNTRFSVISFSNNAELNVRLTDSVSKKALQQKVLKIDYMTGDTYTDKAMNLMLSEGFEGARPNIPKIGMYGTNFHYIQTIMYSVFDTQRDFPCGTVPVVDLL
ncbi:hypothetical protein FSP39_022152 [Pinctada imbricata]|uniref:VWFA domain-containing protein n=1 Tax=Pinctada imbricata TaxID=66713 RepID=A0AA89BJR1_PINIB|nr:hypothetical protein FSP39_022152 [Pinctada imbricata]